MEEKSKVLVVLSGGQDSTTCLFWAKQIFDEVYTITFDYGQRHACELLAAGKVAGMVGVKETILVNIGDLLESTSPLVSDNKLAQYKDAASLPGGLEDTFVPARNLLFLTLAANHAYARGIKTIVTGVCQEDFGGYPDCRQSFITAAECAINAAFGYDVLDGVNQMVILTPLMNMTKAESVMFAAGMEGCFEALAYTHTGYDGKYPPTGKDHATLLRAKGFEEAHLPDPLVCRAIKEGLMEIPETTNYEGFRHVQNKSD
jgi:7-cyano-7-deazaguanine synthase